MPEKAEMEVKKSRDEVILSFPKPKGEKVCIFLLDVQVVEVSSAGVRLQEIVGGVQGRIHTFRPNHKQIEMLVPYLWAHLKLEASMILPDLE